MFFNLQIPKLKACANDTRDVSQKKKKKKNLQQDKNWYKITILFSALTQYCIPPVFRTFRIHFIEKTAGGATYTSTIHCWQTLGKYLQFSPISLQFVISAHCASYFTDFRCFSACIVDSVRQFADCCLSRLRGSQDD